MGLGAYQDVCLADAREQAAKHRRALLSGLDPILAREEERQRKAVETASVVTFAECAATYVASHRAGWRSAKHAEQWTNTIESYAAPHIGCLPVRFVDTALVLKVLEPIWTTKAETAGRLRGRIENILDWAKARGYRSGENPARWKGHLDQLLPTISKKARVEHHKAISFTDAGAFLERVRQAHGVPARCLEFTILTAVRTSEAINARPEEFDLPNATWTIPANRMKMKKEHRVPLSDRAVQIVRGQLSGNSEWVFPSTHAGKAISNMGMLQLLDRMGVDVTVHGFRSTFRDWAAERTAFPHEVCEMALAHTIQNSAEAAYRRGDLFEKRRRLMDAWAAFLAQPHTSPSVVPLMHAA